MLKGKTAFITGSNRGIGKAIVTKFLENGANVICCVRKSNEEFLNYVKLQICMTITKSTEFHITFTLL